MIKPLSSSLATTLRPWGTIPAASGQWPEARNFDRSFGHNPFVQSYLIDTLIGLHQTALFHNTDFEIADELSNFGRPDRLVAANGIARTLWFTNSEHSDWQKKDYTIDTYWEVQEGKYYDAEDGLIADFEAVMACEPVMDSEQRVGDFLRVYSKNPLAQASLLGTLLGMFKKPWEGFSDARQSPRVETRHLSRQLSCLGIAQASWYLASTFPEWSLDDYSPKSEIEAANEMTYHCEERLHHIVQWTFAEQKNLDVQIENDQITIG